MLGVLCVFAVLGGVGCGGGPGKTAKVEGVLTLDGKPVPGVTIIFMPVAKDGRSASGRTDEDGNFRLTTYSTDDGALPGEYKVVVRYSEGSKETVGSDPSKFSDKEKADFFKKMSPKGREQDAAKKTRSPIPEVYGDADKTPLKQVVPPAGKVNLDLSSKAR
jgi:hypothetical protein